MNIFITGANRGLGYALVQKGLIEGHRIFAGVRTLDSTSGKELIKQMETTDQLIVLQVDVTNEDSVVHAKEKILAHSGSLDVIINNAGTLLEVESEIEELDIEACRQSFDVNTLGPLRVIKHLLPLLKKGSQPSILNISSDAGSLTNANGGNYPYGMSKAALNMLGEKLDRSLKEEDIQVLSIHPGWLRTDMGGQKAALDPMEPTDGIFRMLERKIHVSEGSRFVDFKGNKMNV
ncbi:SDR family oxidoreductase [Jeotgalibacillus campisalis]|uniref:3-oxoacyl-ACP reductase n=1 Tax=Jeotgalibacillus campisalis TaxID=220754 RepID=A0A0C2VGE8_9BACL|nr:SDR family oxidoreductase [Jeotgalibacillus campisalis]KIL43053.1 3-oxoacyl-ACP reductase [Jeotgalibacillus campisalis]